MSSAAGFSLRRLAVPVYGPTLLFGLGEGAVLPAIPLAARELGASVSSAALMVALVGVGALLSNIPASLITMRRGERWALVAAALWGAGAVGLCAGTRQLALFALGSFMLGMGQAVFSLARQSYLTDAVPPEYRARAMSLLGGVLRAGMFIGPFAAAAAIHAFGLAGAYGVAVVALVATAALAARVQDPAHEPGAGGRGSPAPTLASTLREHRRVFLTLGIGVVLVAGVRAARQVVLPLWGDHLGLEASVTALVYGLAGGIEMLVFYPAGVVMDRKGRAWVAVPSMVIMGSALLLLPLAQGAWTLLAAALAIGLGNGIGSGMLMTIGADHSPRLGRAHFLGVWRLMADLGSTGGPALLSILSAALSLGAGVALTGVVAFAAAAQLAWWLPRLPRREEPR